MESQIINKLVSKIAFFSEFTLSIGQKVDQKLVLIAVSDTQFSHSCTKRSTDQPILQYPKNEILGLIKIIKARTKSDRAVHWPRSTCVPAYTFTNLSDKAILPSPLSHVIEFKFNILWFFMFEHTHLTELTSRDLRNKPLVSFGRIRTAKIREIGPKLNVRLDQTITRTSKSVDFLQNQ